MSLHDWFIIFGIVQLIHSQEEIWTGFHKKWFLFTMPRWVFIGLEAVLTFFILFYMFNPDAPGGQGFMYWFIFAMLLNGMEHIIWAAVKKRYVPGLVTAPIFVVLFGLYYAGLGA